MNKYYLMIYLSFLFINFNSYSVFHDLNSNKEQKEPVIHQIVCLEPWFSLLKEGIKPVEGRKNSPKYQNIKTGDIIHFVNENNEEFNALVTEIRKYDSLEDYLNNVTIEKAVPGVSSVQEAVEIYL